MSNTEIKHALRKSEFPTCAKDALIKIGKTHKLIKVLQNYDKINFF